MSNTFTRKKLEKLYRHEKLTSSVKYRLVEFKKILEKNLNLVEILLEKPTLKSDEIKRNIFGEIVNENSKRMSK